MKITSKISILFVLLFCTVSAYSQCETYLQKANTLFAEKKYEEAKRQYANYKECKPNATGINEKIAECDRLLSINNEAEEDRKALQQAERSGQIEIKVLKSDAKMLEKSTVISNQLFLIPAGSNVKVFGKESSFYKVEYNGKTGYVNEVFFVIENLNNRNNGTNNRSTDTQKNNETYNSSSSSSSNSNTQTENKKPDRTPGKTYIGIGYFSGYKSNEAETSIRNAFVHDGRFIVSNVQNTSYYGSNQQTSANVDYIVSGTCTLEQYARTETMYIDIPETKWTKAQRIPKTINTPEIVNVAITLTNVRGEIEVSTTYNLNNLHRISGNIFPVKFTIRKIDGKKAEISNITGGTYFIGDIYNVYEVYSNGGKNKIGELKIDKTDEHKITEGAKEIVKRFNAGAKLVVER